jgi:hypothetical protein
VSPNDNNGRGNGATSFTRTYNNNTVVTLTAPSTADGNNFAKWQRNGVDWSATLSTILILDAASIMTAVYVVPPPPAPSGLTASTASGSQINLKWTDVSNETGYRVKRSTTSGGPYTQVGGDLEDNTTIFGNMGLGADTTYYFVVAAFNSSGESSNSNQASATTLSSGACATSTGGSAWVNTAFNAQTGTFTAEFDATPSTGTDNAVVGLSNGSATDYTSQACIVRFRNGHIDARRGGSYSAASTINYTAGTAYHFRLLVNLSLHTYSIYVTPAGESEILVGSNYAFRNGQNAVTQLDNWAVYADTAGSLQVCNFLATTTGGNGVPIKVDGNNASVIYSGAINDYTGSQWYSNTMRLLNAVNGYAQFSFTGASIKWIGMKQFNFGIANVYLDGVVVQAGIDTYGPGTVNGVELFSRTGLANTLHTIKILETGQKNASSTGARIPVDYFEYSSSSPPSIRVSIDPKRSPIHDQFVIRLEGEPGQAYRLETSNDLVNWLPLRDLVSQNPSLEILDRNEPRSNQRFYRLVRTGRGPVNSE